MPTGCVFRHAHVCIKTCLCAERGFLIALRHASLPPHSWSKDQRHYSAIKLLFAGVTHSGSCADGGENALEHHSHMHIKARCSGEEGSGSILCRPTPRGIAEGQKGGRQVKHRANRGVAWHAGRGEVVAHFFQP